MAGAVGFALCVFVDQDKMTGKPLLDSILNGLAGALFASAIAAYIATIVISGIKGKPFFVVMGILALGVPGISFLPMIGAIRIAKPDSTWARKYYDERKMQIARARFAKT